MVLKDHDLRQLSEERILELREQDPDALAALSIRLLQDLKEARERLNQNPSNSSRPPSSEAPWYRGQEDEGEAEAGPEDETGSEEEGLSGAGDEQSAKDTGARMSGRQRRAGRQPGSRGFGRTRKLTVTDWSHHRPGSCALCGRALVAQQAKPYTAFDVLDLVLGDQQAPGLRLTCTRQVYYRSRCDCGHETRQVPHQAPAHLGCWQGVDLSEWRLVGPGLCAFIVWLRFRMRLSLRLVQELLQEVFGLTLGVGTLQRAVMEAARACEPVEDELVVRLLEASLLHGDETPHKQWGESLWLWVFLSASTVLFLIGSRAKEMFQNLIEDIFCGDLMSDGYQVYRGYPKRLRCWAHLMRKARGLMECLSPTLQDYGRAVHETLQGLMQAVYQAREGPGGSLREAYQGELDRLQALCERMSRCPHDQARTLGKELLNDWEVIFRVLDEPHLPLTNNVAERALRHWVILRRISQGTRSEQGSRALALLASVIETCRLRLSSPLRYLREVFARRRQGLEAPPLPAPA